MARRPLPDIFFVAHLDDNENKKKTGNAFKTSMSAFQRMRMLTVILVVTLYVSTSRADIYSWYCNSGTCSSGTCSLQSNFTEGSCVRAPSGNYGTFIRATCQTYPTSQYCVQVSTFGPATIIPHSSESGCTSAIQVVESIPLGFCLPGPDNLNMIITETEYLVNYSYHCNKDCSTCKQSVLLTNNCAPVAGNMISFVEVVPCPQLVSYQQYSDSNCSNWDGVIRYYAAGLANCNGNLGPSNARANLFSCV